MILSLAPIAQQSTLYWEAIKTGVQKTVFRELDVQARYQILRDLYYSNGVYDIPDGGFADDDYPLKPIRNPTFRLVEFYAAVLWPGALPDALPLAFESETDAIRDAVLDIFKWSNWSENKQQYARELPMYGGHFIKAAQRDDGRPYMHLIDPRYIGDNFDRDERGFLTWVRIDMPAERRNIVTGKLEGYVHTEVWSKGWVRVWEHDGKETDLEKLGVPKVERIYTLALAEGQEPTTALTVDFVPIVYIPFRKTGTKHGDAAVMPALDKVHEANRNATRLHQILFRHNKPDKVLEGQGEDAMGRPLAPPELANEMSGRINVGDENFWPLPAGWSLKDTVPNLHYEAALAILNAQVDENAQDLPELTFAKLWDVQDASGAALRTRLLGAIARAEEARGNGEAGMVRAIQMCLTLGFNAGIFPDIGAFDDGAYEMSFVDRAIIPMQPEERADLLKKLTESGLQLEVAMAMAGYSPEDIEAAKKAKQEAMAEATAALVAATGRASAQDAEPGQEPEDQEPAGGLVDADE